MANVICLVEERIRRTHQTFEQLRRDATVERSTATLEIQLRKRRHVERVLAFTERQQLTRRRRA
jgi:hypothetical protein